MKAFVLACASLLAFSGLLNHAFAQAPVYRCESAGKVSYSNEPCFGAKIVDTTPTQGLDRTSGTSRKGVDVRRDETNKQLADAMKPLFNETPEERKRRHNRAKLPEAERAECSALDPQVGGSPRDNETHSSGSGSATGSWAASPQTL